MPVTRTYQGSTTVGIFNGWCRVDNRSRALIGSKQRESPFYNSVVSATRCGTHLRRIHLFGGHTAHEIIKFSRGCGTWRSLVDPTIAVLIDTITGLHGLRVNIGVVIVTVGTATVVPIAIGILYLARAFTDIG